MMKIKFVMRTEYLKNKDIILLLHPLEIESIIAVLVVSDSLLLHGLCMLGQCN